MPKSIIGWSRGPVEWTLEDTVYISIPFTWNLPQSFSRCIFWSRAGYKVRVGGPAVSLMPNYLAAVAEIGGKMNALSRHNPNATRTSLGCPRNCRFCAVPIIEGNLVELSNWEPKSIVCDNNLLACSKWHFDHVVDSLGPIKQIDFNQGLDARFLTKYHAGRLAELDCKVIRLAWDHIGLESQVMSAIEKLLGAGFPKSKIRVYVLIGFNDCPEDALYRLETLRGMDILPNPQRFNPLDTLKRDSYIGPNWTDGELRRYMRYWARQIWLSKIPFNEFRG